MPTLNLHKVVLNVLAQILSSIHVLIRLDVIVSGHFSIFPITCFGFFFLCTPFSPFLPPHFIFLTLSFGLHAFSVRDGGWSTWSDWTPCSASCGFGVQTRDRSCSSPEPKGGQSCSGLAHQTSLCDLPACDHGTLFGFAWL